jgi:hypothetical protein
MEITTVGQLRKELEDYPDDMPVWLGETVTQGGLDYFDRVRKYNIEVTEETQTFGFALPKERQRIERGVVIY